MEGHFRGVRPHVAAGAGDEEGHRPPVAVGVVVAERAVAGRDDREGFAEGVGDLRLDVAGHAVDVVHHRGNIGEDVVVLPLEDVAGRGVAVEGDRVGVVDEAFAEGLDFGRFAVEDEAGGNLAKGFHRAHSGGQSA